MSHSCKRASFFVCQARDVVVMTGLFALRNYAVYTTRTQPE